MLRRSTRIQIVAFVVIAVLVMGYTAIRYANLGRLFGVRGYYVVQLELANGGGIFPQANVTYRGVSVAGWGGRLTSTGVEADLNIRNPRRDPGGPVASRRPVRGRREYVNLRPATGGPPTEAKRDPRRDTQLRCR
jgi:phospholipid/cholesterol/gamma-HCH transport system substrate-binding protein